MKQQRELVPLPVGQRQPPVHGLAYPLPLGFGVLIRRTAFRGAGLSTGDAAGRGHRAPAAAAAGHGAEERHQQRGDAPLLLIGQLRALQLADVGVGRVADPGGRLARSRATAGSMR